MSDSKLAYSRFTTRNVDSSYKVDSYLENIGVVFDISFHDLCQKSFHAELTSFLVDELLFVDCSTTAQNFYRSKKKIASDGIDHIFLQYFKSGATSGLLKNYNNTCNEGSLIFIDASMHWEAFNPSFNNYTIIIPRRLFYLNGIEPSCLHGVVLDQNTNYYTQTLASHFISTFEQIKSIDQSSAAQIKNQTIKYILATLQSTQLINQKNSHQLVKRMEIEKFINENIKRSDLDSKSLSKMMGLSHSTVLNSFDNSSAKIQKHIKRKRLHNIYQDLVNQTQQPLKLSEMAKEHGFKSHSLFTKSFKDHFQCLPKDVLKNMDFVENSNNYPFKWHSWYKKIS